MDSDTKVTEEESKRDWWQKGKIFDLWVIPHFLYGVFMAFLPALTGISFSTALTLTIILALLWEVYEKFTGIKETTPNIVFDIVLPIGTFTLTTYLILLYPLHPDDLTVVATAVLTLYLFTNFSGWRAYRRRKRAFMN